MSIDGTVIDSCKLDDGTVSIHIHQPDNTRYAGQQWLTIVNPEVATIPIGTHIWGCSSVIVHYDKVIADRIGYTRIKMRTPTPTTKGSDEDE